MKYVIMFSLCICGLLLSQLTAQEIGDVTIDRTNNRVVVMVTGSGDVTTDDANMTTAVALLNAEANGGTLGIEGTVVIDDEYTFSKAVSIVGKNPDSQISYTGNGGVIFSWNLDWDPLDVTSFGVTTTACSVS